MKVFSTIFRRPRHSSKKQLAVVVAVLMAFTGMGIFGVTNLTSYSKAEAACIGDPSGNAIMHCGAADRATFISKVKKSAELQKIYAHFGLTSKDYNRFITSAEHGYARRAQNDIVVNGRVVAHNVWTIGRYKSWQGSNPMTVKIAGAGTYYGNYNDKAFSPKASQIPVDVLFNSQGKMQFAVMTSSCGNPATGKLVVPTYACKALHADSLGHNKWSFTTSTSETNGATVDKLVYNFGDGSGTVTTHSGSTVVTHTFSKTATVTVRVYFKLPGGSIVTKDCSHKINYVPPAAQFACSLLDLSNGTVVDNKGSKSFTLTAKATAKYATIQHYSFTYGDGGNKQVNTSATSTSISHTYAPGTYTAMVSVTVKTNTGETKTVGNSGNCVKQFTVNKLASTLSCAELTLTPGTIDKNTGAQSYTLAASATNDNATITKYVFDFGDNASKTINTGATSTSTTHVYTPGTYTATVTVYGTDAFGNPIQSTNSNCAKSVTVQQLPSTLVCTDLTATPGTVDSKGDQAYTFTATATPDHSTVTGYDFTYGDGNSQSVSTSATNTSVSHTYVPGTYTASVAVNGKDANGNPLPPATSSACQATFTVNNLPKTPNVTITKTVDNQKSEQVQVGKSFEYEITVKNTGEVDLTNVAVTDQPPTGVTLLSADLGTVSGNGSAWNYTIPGLAVGESVTVKVVAQVNNYVEGNLVNTACVNAPEVNPDQPNKEDACDTATVTVTPPPAPKVLPNTGAGNVIGLFGTVTIASALGYRFFLNRRLTRQ